MSDTGTVSSSATGDPHITRFDGSRFDFHGVDGTTYHLFAADGVVVIARVHVLPGGVESIFDRVTVQVAGHTADVTTGDVLLDGAEPTAEQQAAGGWVQVRPHNIGAWGYTEVQVPGGGTVGVHRGDGSEPELAGTVLEHLRHLQVFLAGPASWTSGTGVITQGVDGGDPSQFAVASQQAT